MLIRPNPLALRPAAAPAPRQLTRALARAAAAPAPRPAVALVRPPRAPRDMRLVPRPLVISPLGVRAVDSSSRPESRSASEGPRGVTFGESGLCGATGSTAASSSAIDGVLKPAGGGATVAGSAIFLSLALAFASMSKGAGTAMVQLAARSTFFAWLARNSLRLELGGGRSVEGCDLGASGSLLEVLA